MLSNARAQGMPRTMIRGLQDYHDQCRYVLGAQYLSSSYLTFTNNEKTCKPPFPVRIAATLRQGPGQYFI